MNIVVYEKLLDAIRNEGEEPQSYSGRGMFGKECLGVVTDNPTKLIVRLAVKIPELAQDCGEQDEIQEALERSRTDNMGRSTIVYWPSIEWLDLGDEDDDLYDDEEEV